MNTSAPTPARPGQQIPLSRKRSTSNFPDSSHQQPSLKRRKASTLSVSSISTPLMSHPLRQASFPPPEHDSSIAMYSRSPSVDSAVPSSIVSGSVTTGPAQQPHPKKRGRKPKNKNTMIAATASVTGGTMTRAQTPSLMAGVGSRAGVGDDAVTDAGNISGGVDGDGDDDDDDANAAADMTVARATVNELQEQRMLRAMLIKHLDPEQTMRYEKWRSSKLPESAVKRIINATVSQSVPANVVLSVRVATKLFLGKLIEMARQVQGEWIEATGEVQAEIPDPEPLAGCYPHEGGRRGPLRPDHIAEAFQRYRWDSVGGGVGVMGTWHQQTHSGVERFGVRFGGKRMFK